MLYPGTALRRGDPRFDLVKRVQEALGDDGWAVLAADGVFGVKTESAVRYFQTRLGLESDGVVGPVTWAALFRMQCPVAPPQNDGLVQAFLATARGEIGVREVGGRNRGPQIEAYLASVGKAPGASWCVALCYWCFERAAERTGRSNPMFRTAGVHAHWENAQEKYKLPPSAPTDDLRNVTPGTLGHIDHGEGRGHIVIIISAEPHGLQTIEGNTSPSGSRDGDGVYYRTRRYREISLGYVDYSRV